MTTQEILQAAQGAKMPLALADAGIRAGLGGLFTWKSCILLGTALLAVFFYRPFCKWLCPLGAFYGLCNRISICRLQVDSGRCTACGVQNGCGCVQDAQPC